MRSTNGLSSSSIHVRFNDALHEKSDIYDNTLSFLHKGLIVIRGIFLNIPQNLQLHLWQIQVSCLLPNKLKL